MKNRIFIILLTAVITLFLITACSQPTEDHDYGNGEKSEDPAEDPVEEPVNVNGLVLGKTNVLMLKGWTEKLETTIIPSNATNQTIEWSSDNETVAQVSQEGLIVARTDGMAVITAKTAEGNFTATCEVKVLAEAVPVTGIELNKTSTTIGVGGTEQLTAEVLPETATINNVMWSSDNSNIAAVS